jgi:hypothetical protein
MMHSLGLTPVFVVSLSLFLCANPLVTFSCQLFLFLLFIIISCPFRHSAFYRRVSSPPPPLYFPPIIWQMSQCKYKFKICRYHTFMHRVYRVPGILSSRRIGPVTRKRVLPPPPLVPVGGHIRLRREPIRTKGQTLWF